MTEVGLWHDVSSRPTRNRLRYLRGGSTTPSACPYAGARTEILLLGRNPRRHPSIRRDDPHRIGKTAFLTLGGSAGSHPSRLHMGAASRKEWPSRNCPCLGMDGIYKVCFSGPKNSPSESGYEPGVFDGGGCWKSLRRKNVQLPLFPARMEICLCPVVPRFSQPVAIHDTKNRVTTATGLRRFSSLLV